MTDLENYSNLLTEHRPKGKKFKHNYTSELELKSLLIRIKNSRSEIGDEKLNTRINKYIKWHSLLGEKKYEDVTKRKNLKKKLKEKIISDSVKTKIDKNTFERFGVVILLMVKNILKKPQFSGYTYKDDFYSDAVYKILKYLGNFDHTLISKITGTPVNSFAYISQIIHNSVLHIIISKKKESDKMKKRVAMENLNHDLQLNNFELFTETLYNEDELKDNVLTITLDYISTNLVDELHKIQDKISEDYRIELHYPSTYSISFEEYAELKELLHGKISIIKRPNYDDADKR